MEDRNVKPELGRRSFLVQGFVAASAATIAPGVMVAMASGKGEGASSEHRWGLLVDTDKCADGCTSCVDACNHENGIDLHKMPEGQSPAKWEQQRPQWIRKVKLKDKETGKVTNLPMMCQHCEFPPCVDVCPTGASFKRVDGIVMVDRHLCIGCRYCMMACPYKARSFIHEDVLEQLTRAPRGKGCVESCNLCAHRVDAGDETTACAEACQKEGHQAILFGDLKDPNSAISVALRERSSHQIRADLELNTGVRYTDI